MSTPLTEIPGIGPAAAAVLKEKGFKNAEAIAKASPTALGAVPGFGPVRTGQTIAAAIALLSIEAIVKEKDLPNAPKPKKTKTSGKKSKTEKPKKEKQAKPEKKSKSKKKDKKSGKSKKDSKKKKKGKKSKKK